MSKHVSYTEARSKLSDILNQVCRDHEPVIIERRNGTNFVIIAEDDWKAVEETLYLMSSKEDWDAITEPVDTKECSNSSPW
jgi:antitoxin YefM